MTRISFELPDSAVQVVDATTYKGHKVTVLYLFGKEALYYTGEGTHKDGYPDLDNTDWEDFVRNRMAYFFANMLMQDDVFSRDWSKENPTGREVTSNDHATIDYVRDDA